MCGPLDYPNAFHRPAKGVLVRHGNFYYPARLLQLERKYPERQWRVQMWRMCKYEPGEDAPRDLEVTIPESRIVDELWRERDERRKIRVSHDMMRVPMRQ